MTSASCRLVVAGVLALAITACEPMPTRSQSSLRFVDTGVDAPRGAAGHPASGAEPSAPADEPPPRFEFTQPRPDPANALPVYPSGVSGRTVAATVIKIRLRVGSDGTVSGVDELDAPTSAAGRAFVEAVRDACWLWKYTPLVRLNLGRGQTFRVAADGSSEEFKGHPMALPFHIDYAFTFDRHADAGGVSVEMIASASDAFDTTAGDTPDGG